MPYEDPDSSFIVERDSNNRPVIKIRTWDRDGNVEAYMPCNEGMTMNMFMESAKYYAKSPKDGEVLYWFVDKAFKDHREIATGQIYKIGNTKVKITDPGVYGLDIIFVD